MSKVTNLIITCSLFDNDLMPQFQDWFNIHRRKELAPFLITDTAGTKKLECSIYIGAYNYLSIDEILMLIKYTKFKNKEAIRIFIKEQHHDAFNFLPLNYNTSIDIIS